MIVNKYHLRYEFDEKNLVINTLTGAVDFFSAEMLDLLDSAESWELSNYPPELKEDDIEFLLRRGYIFENNEDKERRLNQASQIMNYDQFMHYIICPTYACNFRCTYCFEDHLLHESTRFITEEQIEHAFSAIDILHKESGMDKGLINLFGGEPLLPPAKNMVEKICEEAEKRNFIIGCNTNGYHLKAYADILERFRDCLSVMVSVDGPEEIHDSRRFLSGGQGTFQRIHQGVNELLNRNIPVMIRINIDQTNIKTVPELIKYYYQCGFFGHPSFSITFAPVTDHTCLGLSSTLMKGYEIAKSLIRHVPNFTELEKQKKIGLSPEMFRFFRTGMLLDPELQDRVGIISPQLVYCEATEGKTYAFGPDNNMYACPDLVGKSEYRIGQFSPVFTKEPVFDQWRNFNVLQIPKCKDCSAAMICGGGCAAQALSTYGDLDLPCCPDAKNMLGQYLHELQEEAAQYEEVKS
ncbi:radical SAM/SPASM domain-containing protein [Paenibacillus odorifer]|uniref:radical SAM/SPASM domain-containing protein n=1 Tax=Paenibacillus odorifer TaxID=189426 RepID=UPI002DBB8D20|nr:radical SAM protein [Paenibacillus odorifer]MEC0131761.1 radical SAM protein [Paenibacillus odorifer]MEC0220061.1 radical SAM protein [Paenibacillus odorifer]